MKLPYATVWIAVLCSVPAPALAIPFDDLVETFDVLETVAGTALVVGGGVNGWQSDMENGPALDAELSRPHMAMADWLGNIYIADKDAHAIRLVRPDGEIETIAGTNVAGFNGDGDGFDTRLNAPNGLYTFPNGTTYILDLGNSLIRRLSVDGELTTVVEDPFGMTIGRGLWVSPDESTIFYSSGTQVRQWTEDDGVTIYASGFSGLGNLTIDPATGDVVVTDRVAHSVYRIFEPDDYEQIAGNGFKSGGGGGLPALQVGLDEVRGIQFHPEGGYFLATHDGGQVWFVDDDDIIHLLIDGDDKRSTNGGDGLPLTSPGRKISEPRAVALAPNGDLLVTENDGGYIRRAAALEPLLMGDFNQDRVLAADDIDRLTAAVLANNHPQTLDLNFDGFVDQSDRRVWVEQLRGSVFGDSNLDEVFDSEDFVHVFIRGKYEDVDDGNSGWEDGDWDGDGDFTSEDIVFVFIDGNYQTTAVVPEPAGVGLLSRLLVAWWLTVVWRCRF